MKKEELLPAPVARGGLTIPGGSSSRRVEDMGKVRPGGGPPATVMKRKKLFGSLRLIPHILLGTGRSTDSIKLGCA